MGVTCIINQIINLPLNKLINSRINIAKTDNTDNYKQYKTP